MPSISYDAFVRWVNYHLTTGTRDSNALEPSVQVEDLGRFHMGDLDTGIQRFAKTGGKLCGHVAHVAELMQRKAFMGELGDPPQPFPASLVGRGWSFSNIIGADDGKKRESVLMCDGLSGSVMLAADDLHEAARIDAGSIALVAGGTRLRELVDWAAPFNRSINTSGTHLGATIAGAMGTASHGSRLGFGGIQNMVVGIHLITGTGDNVWLERESNPVLSEQALGRLKPDNGDAVRLLRNDTQFEDVLVHLGCMGIVNCVAVKLVENVRYDKVQWIKQADEAWLQKIADGDWRGIARWLGRDEDPVFYEMTLNPHDWTGASALHMMYFPAHPGQAVEVGSESVESSTVGDAMTQFADAFSVTETAFRNELKLASLPDIDGDRDGDVDQADYVDAKPANMNVFDPTSNAISAYQYYEQKEGFTAVGKPTPNKSWGELHKDEITGGTPGALYNASYAIARADVTKAIPAICAAVENNLPMSFVFTMRFVTDPVGTMAFTRFDKCAVIEIDGLSPWICRKVRRRIGDGAPSAGKIKKMLKYLEFALPIGAKRVGETLDRINVPYSNHFAKRGRISKAKVQADFGPLTNPNSKLSSWRATRDVVLSTKLGRAIFWNWGAVNMGLVDRPTAMPWP